MLAQHGTATVDWEAMGYSVTSSQKVREHRTGNAGFATEEEHAVLKRVLLAYARYNKATGYCQGFNIIAAMILKVMNFDDQLALKARCRCRDEVIKDTPTSSPHPHCHHIKQTV
ncbi:hypothetical protein EMCRGX_G024150 [Ephydatia muelleri]